jgi:hypothetical protein
MRVLSDGRVRRTEAEWRGLLERFEKSGRSMTAFCARAKLARSSFVKWKRRLAGRPAGERPPQRSPAFVEWLAPSVAQGEAAPERGAGELELSLPGGVVLRWRA